ncbi:MAG: hypothetical protein JOZ67_02890 [Gammaproteobacteria bacterium]|nr:hypothetical protein [Gammaproteobacteria bacterium]
MAERPRHRAHLLPALMLLALGGCADQGKQREAELTDLLSWLQGSYDNRAQADADAQKAGHAPRERIALLVMPVYVPRVGKHVLYAQESAADDPRRVMSERLFSFDIDEKRGIVGLVFDFVEPRRWRDGQNNPEIFTSVVTQDVSPSGCELLWHRAGQQFIANVDPKRCRVPPGGPGGNAAELGPDYLNVAGFQFRRSR